MVGGPLEIVEIVFPGNRFNGEVIPSLQRLVQSRTVRILDIGVISRTATGDIVAMEVADLDPAAATPLLELVDGAQGLFSDEDFIAFGNALEPNSTAAIIIFENTWAAEFVAAVHGSGGEVVLNERIPRHVAEALAASIA